jgi:hypothetical protein
MHTLVTLTVTESRYGKPLELGRWRWRSCWNKSKEKLSDVRLGSAQVVVCFGFGLSHGGCNEADPGALLGGVETEALVEGQGKEAFVKIFESGGCLVQGYDGWAQLSFAFRFLVGLVDAVEVGVAEKPSGIEMGPNVMENFLQPSRAGVQLGTDFIVVVDVGLLELYPVVAKATAQEMGPSDVVLAGDEDFKIWFTVVGIHFQSRVVLERAADTEKKDRFEIWLGVQFG